MPSMEEAEARRQKLQALKERAKRARDGGDRTGTNDDDGGDDGDGGDARTRAGTRGGDDGGVIERVDGENVEWDASDAEEEARGGGWIAAERPGERETTSGGRRRGWGEWVRGGTARVGGVRGETNGERASAED